MTRRGGFALAAALATTAWMVSAPAAATAAPCDAMLGWGRSQFSAGSVISASDLARLRDIGRSDTGSDQAPAASVSPDGGSIAFVVRRADPSRDRFCQTLVVQRRDGRGTPRTIPLPGEPARLSFDLRGLWMPLGMFAVAQPKWSPDGEHVALVVAIGGVAQIVSIDWRRSSTEQITRSATDVADLAWRRDGLALVYATRAGSSAFETALAREARSGFLYDARVWPAQSAVPLPPAAIPTVVRTFELARRRETAATPGEQALLVPPRQLRGEAIAGASLSDGASAWITPQVAGRWGTPQAVVAQVAGTRIACAAAACQGRIPTIWADDRHRSFIFSRREGWGGSSTALYRWRPGRDPVRILATSDLLLGCQSFAGTLLCARESSLRPRRLVSIDLATGDARAVFDPNPEFANFDLGRVERLHWSANLGVEAFGDLVLPPGPRSAVPLPLIVVQYRTRGFLRGAIGDEIPILPLAARGFAVLSLEDTPEYATVVGARATSYDEAAIVDGKDWAERRLILSSLEAGVAAAERTVPIDPGRIAVTGLSDGAATAWFALINTKIFSLASLSTPAFDPKSILPTAGPALEAELRRWGYPAFGDAAPAFWSPVSPALNAGRITVPLLFQYSDDEYLMGLEAFTALREADRAVEMYIFPGEHHVKWQAAHRLALYTRNLDWFDFWFRDRIDPDSRKRLQYERWTAMRSRGCQSRSALPPSPVPPSPVPAIPAQLCSQASTSTNMAIRR